MSYGTLKDYVERLGLFPSYKAPKYLGKDIEFAFFEFIVPHSFGSNAAFDTEDVLPDGWMMDMVSLPVYTGIELTKTDETFTYYKCKVPLCLMKSPMGMGYFAPQMIMSNDMPPPSPDDESALDKAFEKAKQEPAAPEDCQWEVKLQCNCGAPEITEIHKTATEGLVARYCGECQSTRLNLVSLKPIIPQDD